MLLALLHHPLLRGHVMLRLARVKLGSLAFHSISIQIPDIQGPLLAQSV